MFLLIYFVGETIVSFIAKNWDFALDEEWYFGGIRITRPCSNSWYFACDINRILLFYPRIGLLERSLALRLKNRGALFKAVNEH